MHPLISPSLYLRLSTSLPKVKCRRADFILTLRHLILCEMLINQNYFIRRILSSVLFLLSQCLSQISVPS